MTDRNSRRDFLRAAGAVLGGALGGSLLGACTTRGEDAADTAAAGAAPDTAQGAPAAIATAIGVQLYTVRSLMERDVEGTLAEIARIGYREVEFAGYYGRVPARLRETLDRLGLAAPSTHVPLDAMRAGLDGVLASAQTLGHRWVVIPWVAEGERTEAGYRRIAGELNRWGTACSERGLRLAYHNHDFEFRRTGSMVPFDFLLAETDPALVAMELDLYWITFAGQDPLAYFERHSGRFPLWQVKDGRGPNAREMTAVGEGEIDFRTIFDRASQAGRQHMFVEHDDPADPLAILRTSYENVRRLLG